MIDYKNAVIPDELQKLTEENKRLKKTVEELKKHVEDIERQYAEEIEQVYEVKLSYERAREEIKNLIQKYKKEMTGFKYKK